MSEHADSLDAALRSAPVEKIWDLASKYRAEMAKDPMAGLGAFDRELRKILGPVELWLERVEQAVLDEHERELAEEVVQLVVFEKDTRLAEAALKLARAVLAR